MDEKYSAEIKKDKDPKSSKSSVKLILKNDSTKKVNLNDLVSRSNIEKKKERRGTYSAFSSRSIRCCRTWSYLNSLIIIT